MAKFDYVALDAKGTETSGMLEADNTVSAINQLKEQGFFPTSVVEVGKAKKKKRGGAVKGKGLNIELSFLGGGKVKSKVLTAFTRQLATLIDAGLPLLRGLMVLENQEKNVVLKRVIGECADSVQGGATFSEALAGSCFERRMVPLALLVLPSPASQCWRSRPRSCGSGSPEPCRACGRDIFGQEPQCFRDRLNAFPAGPFSLQPWQLCPWL